MSSLFDNQVKFYSIKDVMNLSGLSHKSITKAIHSSTLKAKKISNKWKINHNDFELWKDNGYKLENIVSVELDNRVRDTTIKEIDIKEDFNSKEKMNDSFTFIDIFAGAGGITTGLTMAGGQGICGLEIMPEACDTYRSNFDHPILCEDVTQQSSKNKLYEIVEKHYGTKNITGKVDVITGGFPCQGFSMAGNRVVDDERNSLYKELKEIVNHLKPKFILMENVVGLRTMLNGKWKKR
jgi:DNA (cytosine-5)-methyltransferase 1